MNDGSNSCAPGTSETLTGERALDNDFAVTPMAQLPA
jgi:hypothetical protein